MWDEAVRWRYRPAAAAGARWGAAGRNGPFVALAAWPGGALGGDAAR